MFIPTMSTHPTHPDHDHVHGANCGHLAIRHDGHIDYLHDGHLHAMHGDHVDECVLAVDSSHPATCTSGHACKAHAADHVHGDSCGHPAIPHGDHVDYLVDGHLHHAHGSHCDNHGPVRAA
jgi:hypothetical protein